MRKKQKQKQKKRRGDGDSLLLMMGEEGQDLLLLLLLVGEEVQDLLLLLFETGQDVEDLLLLLFVAGVGLLMVLIGGKELLLIEEMGILGLEQRKKIFIFLIRKIFLLKL